MAIQEVDEDDEDDNLTERGRGPPSVTDELEEVEEVDSFSPIVKGPGEIVEEKIYEEGEEETELKAGLPGLQPAATITPSPVL